jgi:hypothetical protein
MFSQSILVAGNIAIITNEARKWLKGNLLQSKNFPHNRKKDLELPKTPKNCLWSIILMGVVKRELAAKN